VRRKYKSRTQPVQPAARNKDVSAAVHTNVGERQGVSDARQSERRLAIVRGSTKQNGIPYRVSFTRNVYVMNTTVLHVMFMT